MHIERTLLNLSYSITGVGNTNTTIIRSVYNKNNFNEALSYFKTSLDFVVESYTPFLVESRIAA